MSGRLYIDGNDAYLKYGAYVTDGGWNELIAYPPLKSVDSNDWQEVDGIEADLSAPVLNTREVQLKMAVTGFSGHFSELLELLSDGAYHTFGGTHIGRTYRLRLVSQPDLSVVSTLGTVTLKFADDFPLSDYTYQAPESAVESCDDYSFDGVKFTDYGVRILKGSLGEVMKAPDVKKNLLRNIGTQPGAIYDGDNVTYADKDVNLYCLMRASTLTELWRNYDALLYDLIRPGERSLNVKALSRDFPFCYKSGKVTAFYPDGKIWLEFTLTLTFTQGVRDVQTTTN